MSYLVICDWVSSVRIEVGECSRYCSDCITCVLKEHVIKFQEVYRDCDARLTGCSREEASFNQNLEKGLTGACRNIDDFLICRRICVSGYLKMDCSAYGPRISR